MVTILGELFPSDDQTRNAPDPNTFEDTSCLIMSNTMYFEMVIVHTLTLLNEVTKSSIYLVLFYVIKKLKQA